MTCGGESDALLKIDSCAELNLSAGAGRLRHTEEPRLNAALVAVEIHAVGDIEPLGQKLDPPPAERDRFRQPQIRTAEIGSGERVACESPRPVDRNREPAVRQHAVRRKWTVRIRVRPITRAAVVVRIETGDDIERKRRTQLQNAGEMDLEWQGDLTGRDEIVPRVIVGQSPVGVEVVLVGRQRRRVARLGIGSASRQRVGSGESPPVRKPPLGVEDQCMVIPFTGRFVKKDPADGRIRPDPGAVARCVEVAPAQLIEAAHVQVVGADRQAAAQIALDAGRRL